MRHSNKLIRHLFKEGNIESPIKLPHFGGRQYRYYENGEFAGNIKPEELARIICYMSDEEILKIMNSD